MSRQHETGYNSTVVARMVQDVLDGTWSNVSAILTPWQKETLSRLSSDQLGIQCLLRMWIIEKVKLPQGEFCNATWDNHYCWPYAAAGTTTSRECSEAFEESEPTYAAHIKGTAIRHCLPNGTWMHGSWTNYTECADSYDEYIEHAEQESELRNQVRLIVFIGSILSLVCLLGAITIFCCFRSIWCDRITLHVHLMAALTLRYIFLYIITEAFIFNRNPSYRSEDWICKTVLGMYLYATVSAVNWMLIQGLYLNRILTNAVENKAPLKSYCIFGWVLPAVLLGIYTIVMQLYHPVHCWTGYSDMDEIWIILGPIAAALTINLLLLINILRVLTTQVHNPCVSSDFSLFKRAAKATLVLSPILGINNLLFIYNPGGIFHKYYVLLNSFFGSTQGILVAISYCFMSSDVCNAVRRCYRRFLAQQQNAHSRRAQSNSSSSGVIVERPVNLYKTRIRSTSQPSLPTLGDRPLSPAVAIQTCYRCSSREEPKLMHTLYAFDQDLCRSAQQLESSPVIVPLSELL